MNGGEDRYALSAFMTLDKGGNLLYTSLHNSIINSKVRGVYSELNDIIEKGKSSDFYPKYAHVYGDFAIMMELYAILKRKSITDGAMELEGEDVEIKLDETGHPVSIIKRERGESEKLIEQFMLCANRGVASYLKNMEMPCVYRIHESPDTEKTDAFLNFANNLGVDISCAKLGRTPSPKQLSLILENARELGKSEIVSSVLLRSLMKAKYSAEAKPHFGLATDLYCHFTSPIRRYPDLSVHRIIKAVLSGSITADKVTKLSVFAEKSARMSSENELRALYAEREIDDLYKTVYMADRIGEEIEGSISSVTSFGFFVRTDDMCEGLVPISTLNGEFFFDEANYTLTSASRIFKLGQRATVSVTEADIISRKVTFTLVSCEEAMVPREKRIPASKKVPPQPQRYRKDSKKRDFRSKDSYNKERKYSKNKKSKKRR